jgi:osmoprotectant transport system substrate-binding protein
MNARPNLRRGRAIGMLAAATALTALVGCGSSASAPPTTPLVAQRITITYQSGSAENELLASIYGQALEAAGYRVARKNPLADELALFQAVNSNDVQLVVDHTGSLLKLVVGLSGKPLPVTASPAQQRAALITELPPTVTVGTPAPASHNEVIACSVASSTANSLTTISSLATVAGTLKLGAPAGFDTSTPLGAGTLAATYKVTFGTVVPLADDALQAAVKDGTVDCIVTDSYSPIIAQLGMTILDDDMFLVPTESVIPVLSTTAAGVDVVGVVDATSAKITTQALNGMLNQMATNGTSADVVARAFLQTNK